MARNLIVLGLLLIVSAAAWWAFSPLLFDQVVSDERPDVIELSAQDLSGGTGSGDASDAEADSGADQQAAEIVRRGAFSGADASHSGEGDALLIVGGPEGAILRFENFRVTNGPDLEVYLTRRSDIMSARDVVDGGFVSLGALRGNVGDQNYSIPDDVDLDEFGAVVIWCEAFSVLFASANLR